MRSGYGNVESDMYYSNNYDMDNSAWTMTEEESQSRIIKSATVRMETDDFELDEAEINSVITARGGYVENADVSSRTGRNDRTVKLGSYTFRVPSETFDSTVDALRAIGKIVSVSVSSEDVTLTYRHTDSKLKAKLVEEERVLEIMRGATSIHDLLQLERRLSEINAEIEFLQTRLNNIDSLANYSRITLYLSEDGTAGDKGVINRMSASFSGSVDFMGEFFTLMLVILAGAAVPLGFITAVGAAALLFIHMSKKLNRGYNKHNIKNEDEEL
jgi:hypothetical protein